MEITGNAVAGTLESSDVFLEIRPNDKGIEIELNSIVMNQYGDEIRDVIKDVLKEMRVENAHVRANDRGALECVIRARVQTAVLRAGKEAAQ